MGVLRVSVGFSREVAAGRESDGCGCKLTF